MAATTTLRATVPNTVEASGDSFTANKGGVVVRMRELETLSEEVFETLSVLLSPKCPYAANESIWDSLELPIKVYWFYETVAESLNYVDQYYGLVHRVCRFLSSSASTKRYELSNLDKDNLKKAAEEMPKMEQLLQECATEFNKARNDMKSTLQDKVDSRGFFGTLFSYIPFTPPAKESKALQQLIPSEQHNRATQTFISLVRLVNRMSLEWARFDMEFPDAVKQVLELHRCPDLEDVKDLLEYFRTFKKELLEWKIAAKSFQNLFPPNILQYAREQASRSTGGPPAYQPSTV